MNFEIGQIWRSVGVKTYIRFVRLEGAIMHWKSLLDPDDRGWRRDYNGASYLADFQNDKIWIQHTSIACVTCDRLNACRSLEVECAECRHA